MTKEDYRNLNNTLECYDGRGQGIDIYKCEICGSEIHTRYKDKGVTPFIIRCRKQGCKGYMHHASTVAESKAIVCDWYRPSYRYYKNAWRDIKDHLEKGGLILDEKPLREANIDCSIVK